MGERGVDLSNFENDWSLSTEKKKKEKKINNANTHCTLAHKIVFLELTGFSLKFSKVYVEGKKRKLE